MRVTKIDPKIIIALDYSDKQAALNLVKKLDPIHCRLKVGKQMFTAYGPDFVKHLIDSGFDVFLDLKFHDIPNTVAKACEAAMELGVWMLNVHALGGLAMLEAARAAIPKDDPKAPLLIAVTLLTSLNESDIRAIGLSGRLTDHVVSLARLAESAELDGVVCSPLEISLLREHIHSDFILVTPGIRLPTDELHDQQRTLTPGEAIRRGANYLVIGRSITLSEKPKEILRQIELDIAQFSN